MQNNNLDLLFDLNLEYLKIQLKGEPVDMQKGIKLEEFFNYSITKAIHDGNCLENLNDNITLFNYRKSKSRSFQVYIAGLVKVQENNDEISINTEDTEKTNYKNYKFEFLNYDFFDENEIVKLNYENTKIEYELKTMKFLNETRANINLDLCELIKDTGKKNAEKSVSNVFERAKSIFNSEEKIKTLFKEEEFEIPEIKKYYDELLSFSFILKKRFNHSQKGYPNLIKFSQIKGKVKLYFFHAMFIREIDGAYKVISKYNLSKAAGINEKKFDEKKNENIFAKNDVLLFEIKDSKVTNYCLNCMYDNYEVINGYVKILKNKKEFKNCEFYYIGIQEKNREEKEKDVNKNITEGILKIKLFFFHNNIIFGQNYCEMDPEKLKVLNLLNDEFSEIDKKFESIERKFENIEKNFEKKFNIIIFGLIVLIIIILLKKN